MNPTPITEPGATRITADGSSSGQPVDSLADIGTHLRAARIARGLTLREMARRIEVSPSFVSQVELGKAKPSLGTLYGFLSELDLSLDELMPPSGAAGNQTSVTLNAGEPDSAFAGIQDTWVRRDGVPQRWIDHPLVQMAGVTWRRLTTDDPLVDFLRVTYEPGAESCPTEHFMRHEGHEYGLVIAGSMLVQIAFETFELNVGDSINFPSTTPHRLSNPGSQLCESIWVVVGRRSSSPIHG